MTFTTPPALRPYSAEKALVRTVTSCSAANGTLLNAWGSQGSDQGEFVYPTGVAVARDGTVFVADRFNDRIQRFTATGDFLTTWGSTGNDAGEFAHPSGVAVDRSCAAVVADSENQRIQVFRPHS